MTTSREPSVPDGVDITRPGIGRVFYYLLDGKDKFAADRAVTEKLTASNLEPNRLALVTRDFLIRAVGFAARSGVAQFLDLGSGLPASPSVHEIARQVIPDARVVYVDNDPVVIARNRALLATGDGIVTIQADVREPGRTGTTARPSGSARAPRFSAFSTVSRVEPGLVAMQDWRPAETTDRSPLQATNLSGVAVLR